MRCCAIAYVPANANALSAYVHYAVAHLALRQIILKLFRFVGFRNTSRFRLIVGQALPDKAA